MIPIEFRMPLKGKMNKGISECIKCQFKAPNYNVTPFILGFSETPWGEMVIWECPECNENQFFHYVPKNYFDYLKAFKAFKSGNQKWILEG